MAQYWRLTGISTRLNGALELSELQVYEAGAMVTGTLTCTAPGSIAALSDSVTSAVVSWAYEVHSAPGFALVWDFGATAVVAPALRLGGGNSIDTFPQDMIMQSSADGLVWANYKSVVGITYPGNLTLSDPATQEVVVATDALFDSVTLLLHGEAFTDYSKTPKTITGNTTAISTAVYKFGTGSYLFSTSSVSIPTSLDWYLSGDFTIELWVKPTNTSVTNYVIGRGLSGTQKDWDLIITNAGALSFTFWQGDTNASTVQTAIGVIVQDTWQHIAVSRSTGTATIFVDGVSCVSGSSVNRLDYNIGWPVLLGHSPSSTYPYSGYMDDVRVTNAARYTAAFTPPTAAFPNSAPVAEPNADPLWSQVVLAMTMNDATDLKGHVAVRTVGNVFVAGKFGNAINCTVSTTEIGFTYAPEFNLGSGDFTIDFFYAKNDNSEGGGLVSQLGPVHASYFITRGTSNSLKLTFYTAASFGGQTDVYTAADVVPAIGTFKHYAVVRTGGFIQWYVDGVASGTAVAVAAAIYASNGDLAVFANNGNVPACRGTLDDVRITKAARWTANFTAPIVSFAPDYDPHWANTIVAMHMNDAVDLKGHTVTPTNAVYAAAVVGNGIRGNSVGTTTTVVVDTGADLSLPADFTIDFHLALHENNNNPFVYQGTAGNTCFYISYDSGNSRLMAGLYTGPNNTLAFYPYSGQTVVANSTFHHYALIKSGSSVQWYKDGVASGFSVTVTAAINPTAEPLRLFSTTLIGGTKVDCTLDEFRITKAARWTAAFTPPTSAFLEGAPATTDVLWDQVVLAMRMEDATDLKGHTASLVTAEFTGNGMFNKGSTPTIFNIAGASNSCGVRFPASADWYFGTGDFTIDFWYTRTSDTGDNRGIISGNGWDVNTNHSSGGNIIFRKYAGPSRTTISNVITTYGFLPLNTPAHVAIVGYNAGTYFKVFINGVMRAGQWPLSAGTYDGASALDILGADLTFDAPSCVLDDLRITKGTARWIEDFTPPTAAFLEGGAAPIDAFWNDTVLAMHMEDAVDLKGHPAVQNGWGNGALTAVAGKFGNAMSITTTMVDLSMPYAADLQLGSGDFTIDFWLDPTTTATTGTIIGCTTSSNCSFLIYLEGNNDRVHGAFYTAGGFAASTEVWSPAASLLDGTYRHVAIVRTAGFLTIYTNGVAGTPVAISGSVWDCAGRLSIGYCGPGVGLSTPAKIDDLRITKAARWTANFTPPTAKFPEVGPALVDEFWGSVALLVQPGASLTDIKSGIVPALAVSANTLPTVAATGPFGGGCADFTYIAGGNSSGMTYTSTAFNVTNASTFSLEFWFYPRTISATYQQNLVAIGDRNATGVCIYTNTDGTIICFAQGSLTITGSVVALNTWHHIALCFSNGALALFVDGIKYSNTSTLITVTTSILRVGRLTGFDCIDGKIAGIRFTSGVLRYTANFTPPTAAFPETNGVVIDFLAVDAYTNRARSLNTPILFNSQTAQTFGAYTVMTNVIFADTQDGGLGMISGTVKEKHVPSNLPLHRKVWLVEQRSQRVIRETWSDETTGNYSFTGIKIGPLYTVIAFDYTGAYRAVISDSQGAV